MPSNFFIRSFRTLALKISFYEHNLDEDFWHILYNSKIKKFQKENFQSVHLNFLLPELSRTNVHLWFYKTNRFITRKLNLLKTGSLQTLKNATPQSPGAYYTSLLHKNSYNIQNKMRDQKCVCCTTMQPD